MNSTLELSDKIEQLFSVAAGEFKPEYHLPLAVDIVSRLGEEKPRWWNAGDLIEYERGGILRIGPELQRIGHYVVRRVSRCGGNRLSGFHPELDITHWKDELFRFRRPCSWLCIAYEKKEVKKIWQSAVIPHSVFILGYSLTYVSEKTEWVYRP